MNLGQKPLANETRKKKPMSNTTNAVREKDTKMNTAELEHIEHELGVASEFSNCLTEAEQACSRRNHEAADRISAAIAAGLFVLVEEGPMYCRATDALAGTVTALISEHVTREEAEAAQVLRDRYDTEVRLTVLPAREVEVVAVEPEMDECPF